MELVEGVKVSDAGALAASGVDGRAVAGRLNDVYADMLFRRGILHADPHPGNLLVQPGPEGPRLVLLDHGLTVDLDPSFVAAPGEAVGAMREGDLDRLTGTLREAGLPVDRGANVETLLGLVGVLLGNGSPGGSGADFAALARSLGAGVRGLPPKLLLVGRAISLLDGITGSLDPDLDALQIVTRYAGTP